MKNKFKIFLALMLIAVTVFGTSSALASEDSYIDVEVIPESAEIAEEIDEANNMPLKGGDFGIIYENPKLRGTSKPYSVYDISKNGVMSFSGSTTVPTTLYTDKKFTGFSSGKLRFSNGYYYDQTIEIYRAGWGFDTKVISVSCPVFETRTWNLSGFDSGAQYYIKIPNMVGDFGGSIG